MDISKLINDRKPSNRSLRGYKEEMFGSWGSKLKRINEISEIPFSYEIDRYFEIIQKYVKDDRSFHRAIHGINKFIDSCLLMGELLYKAKNSGIPIVGYLCESAFTLVTALYPDQDIKDRESPKFLNIIVRLHTIIDNVVYIHISESERRTDYKECEFTCNRSYYIDRRIPGMDISPARDSNKYNIMNERFNPPPYDKLPLYINVPFMNEYARYMLENPPPPPPTFERPFFSF
jgi:hypothetical protein